MKTILKRFVTKAVPFMGAVALLAAGTLNTVRADVIWEPEDAFYQQGRDHCSWNGRNYITNGPNGDVKAYVDPKTNTVVETIANGTVIFVSFTYVDDFGREWGCIEEVGNGSGWVPMDYLVVEYDYIAFQEEYGNHFVTQEGVIGDNLDKDYFYGWTFPGSTMNIPLVITDKEQLPVYNTVYIDENDRRWAFVAYYFGNKNFWVCVDAPSAEYAELFPNGSSVYDNSVESQPASIGGEKDLTQEATQEENARPAEEITPVSQVNTLTYVLVGALVVAVVAGTAIILLSLRGKKKK